MVKLKPKSKAYAVLTAVLYPLITVGAVVLLWWAGSVIVDTDLILPSPGDTFRRMLTLLSERAFWLGYGGTLLRSLISFVIGFILAAGLSLLSYLFPVVRRIVSPLISFLRALPTVAVILLLVVWFKPAVSAVVVSLLVVMPTLYAALYSALINISQELIDTYRVYTGTRRSFLTTFTPMLLPDIVESVAGGLSLNIKLMIAAEALSGTARSLGSLMQTAQAYLNIDKLLALTVLAVITAALLEYGIKTACKPFIRWR